MQVKTHPFAEEEMMAYLDGEFSLDEAKRVEEHLTGCEKCRGVVDDLKHISGAMRGWKPPAVRKDWTVPIQQTRQVPWKWLAAAAAVVIVCGVGIEIWRAPSRMEVYAPAYEGLREQRAVPQALPQPLEQHAVISGAEPSRLVVMPQLLKIAREADMAITVDRFDEARSRMEQMVKTRGGYVSELAINGAADEPKSLSATLKVPTAELDALYKDLRSLGQVDKESQRGEDVTRQSIDTDARLANLRETEKRLTAILQQRTGKLSDVLEVEEQIARVRGEIETAEAEKKALANRVTLASVKITIAERYRKPVASDHAALSIRLRNAAVEGWQGVVALVEGVAVLLLRCGPVLLLVVAVLFWPGRQVWKRLRNIG